MPLNRIVAFIGPYIAVGSGVVADWLVVHLHLLSTFHLGKSVVTPIIAQVAVFAVTALVVWLGHQKWLTGWIEWEKNIASQTPPELKVAVEEAIKTK